MKIEINEDIENYKETVVLGLTAQQAVFSAFSLVAGAGIVLLLYEKVGMMAGCYLATPFVIPIALMGFYQYNGMNFFQFISRFVKSFALSKPLPYRSMENKKDYEKLLNVQKEELPGHQKTIAEHNEDGRNEEKQILRKKCRQRKIILAVGISFLSGSILLSIYLFYMFGIRQGMDMTEFMELCLETIRYLFE